MKKIPTILICLVNFSGLINAQAPTIQWQKCYGGSSQDALSSFVQTLDGGYVFAASTGSIDGDVSGNHDTGSYSPADFWIVKVNSTGTLQWQKCLGGSAKEYPHCIQQTSDHGFIVCGYASSTDGNVNGIHTNSFGVSVDWWIVKLDSAGNMQWQKCLGGYGPYYSYIFPYGEVAFSIRQNQDGGYLICGTTNSSDGDVTCNLTNNSAGQGWIVKINATGDIQWQNCAGTFEETDLFDIQNTSDGGYIVAGDSILDLFGSYEPDYLIAKFDSNGNLQWKHHYGGSRYDVAYSIKQTSDGGYIVAGITRSNDGDVSGNHDILQNQGDYWIIKLDVNGLLQWQKCFGGMGADVANSIQVTSDGGYIVTGGTFSNNDDVIDNHGDQDCWVVKLDSTGNLQWQVPLGGSLNDVANSVIQTSDSGYMVAGTTYSNDQNVSGNHGQADAWLVKLKFPTQPCNISINPASANVCSGLTAVITASGATTYSWSPSLGLSCTSCADPLANPSATTTYTVTGDGGACSNSIVVSYIGPHINILTHPCINGSVLLTALTSPPNGLTYHWIFDNNPILGATNSTYSATAGGAYRCKIVMTSTGCKVASKIKQVSVLCKLGEEAPVIAPTVTLYPNLAFDQLTIETENISAPAKLIIINQLGEMIREENLNGDKTELDVSSFAPGTYFLEIQSRDINVVKKFVKE